MPAPPDVVWLTVEQVAAEVQTGRKAVYRAIKRADLRAARIGARGDLRVHREWITAWLTRLAEPREIRRVS